jgi:hypothetical protein
MEASSPCDAAALIRVKLSGVWITAALGYRH